MTIPRIVFRIGEECEGDGVANRASLEAKIEACYKKMCERLEKKLSKSIDVSNESPPPHRHPNYQVHHRTRNLAVALGMMIWLIGTR